MSENQTDDQLQQDELTVLKERATKLGIKFHPSTGLEKLKTKVNLFLKDKAAADKIDVETPEEDEEEEKELVVKPKATEKETKSPQEAAAELPVETEEQRNTRLRKDAARLVRVRVSVMNPDKRLWRGEIFTVSNSIVGTHKKFVPFNNEEGFHVPNIIYKAMLEKKCQVFSEQTIKGQKKQVGRIISELNVERLDPLTPEELKDLAQRQAMAGTIDQD